MKKTWSSKWIGSVQPRKQRKYRYNAPLHVKHKFLSAHLSRELRERFGKRSVTVRKGDEVTVMKGEFKGFKGNVDRVELSRTRIYVDGMKRKKVDASEVSIPIHPSNVMITKLNLEDKMRQAVFERSGRKSSKPSSDEGTSVKEEEKPAKAQKARAVKEKAKHEQKAPPEKPEQQKEGGKEAGRTEKSEEKNARQKAEHEHSHHKEKDW